MFGNVQSPARYLEKRTVAKGGNAFWTVTSQESSPFLWGLEKSKTFSLH